jgi:hypothetical protein
MKNVDAQGDRTVTVRGRAEEGEDAAGRERCVSPIVAKDVLIHGFAAADSVRNLLLEPQGSDLSELADTIARVLLRNSQG